MIIGIVHEFRKKGLFLKKEPHGFSKRKSKEEKRFWYTIAQENCWSATQKERVHSPEEVASGPRIMSIQGVFEAF